MWASTSSGMPSSRSTSLRAWRSGGSASPSRSGHFGSGPITPLSNAHGEARRVRGDGELVDQLVDALRARVGEAERAAVEIGLVGDVLERARHPVDGDDVRVAEVEPHQRRPLGQQLAHPLDRLEEVVRAVDLVHLARVRVADDDTRPVHPPGHVRLLAHDPLGLVLRAVIGRGQALALVEHVLGEHALVGAGDGDRGHVVKAPRADRPSQLDRVGGAADVHRRVALGRRGHVVDGRQVEEVLDRPAQLLHLFLIDPQHRPAQVAEHGLHTLLDGRSRDHPPALDQLVQAARRFVAYEHVHLALALFQDALHQAAPDEAGGSGDEVGHAQASIPGGTERARRCQAPAGSPSGAGVLAAGS